MKFQHWICLLFAFLSMIAAWVSMNPSRSSTDTDRICNGLAGVVYAVLACVVLLFYGLKEPEE